MDLAPTGRLRASINLGNPVLTQGSADEPSGVTVDIARELAARLDVPLELVCFDAARASFDAMTQGRADICFLAIEPARAEQVAFTAPYVLIEGVFVVPTASELGTPQDVDRDGVRIGVNLGSAYDLFLSRGLQHATLVRADDGLQALREQHLEAGAGVRQPVTGFVARHTEYRLIDEPFMQICQALGTTKDRAPEAIRFLSETIEELKANGFVRAALDRAGHGNESVAPPSAVA